MATETETERFARLMRGFKERSGRSYGTLAKRLHSSNSTLHRYCSGAAVPTDYAPVERFARVCGASADELLALHQQWLLALVERRQGVPEGVPDGVPDGVPAAAPTSAPAAAETEPGPGPEPAPVSAVLADSPDVLVQPGAVRDASVPTTRRRRLLLAVAATVATAAVAGAAAAVSAMGDRGPGATSHGAVPSVTSASASPATAKAGASPAAPFTVTVLPDNWDTPCDQWFALDKAPGTVPPPPAGQATEGWARALGAAPAGHLRMQLTVQGTESKATVLHALYVHVVSGRKAPAWNAYTMGAGCGGTLVPASFAVNLDDASPRARPVPGKEGERPTPTTDFPYKVSTTDPQVLNVDASTLGRDVSWYLELAWSSGGRKGTTRIDDHGRPFRTVALNAGHDYWYEEGANAWLPYTE
ncbi:helix-turn-helix domain-containing protein [Streptomyces sp. NPDC056144]|uniref:helix-turn-helix domain-containing protein n=1 Tax=unclassified Streptomyces TaxID=2593676 RepID=UPI0035D99576